MCIVNAPGCRRTHKPQEAEERPGPAAPSSPDVAEPGSRIQLPGPWGCHPVAHAGAFKGTDQSSCRRVLPLNYRAVEEAQARVELASGGVRPSPVGPAIGGDAETGARV
ncbi:hypothetical protein GCM10010398_03520 [Streptomyces fimbriatus]